MINNVTRLLDSKKILYKAFSMPVEKLGAQETARLLNVPENIVYKTIVAMRPKPGKPILAVIPGDHQLDLKALAHLVNEKKINLPSEREAETLTGLQAGGISPLALINQGFQVLIDAQAESLEFIHLSGGQRGLNIRMSATDLGMLTRARFGNISRPIDPDGKVDS
jgi:Cys-tRNA(Pro)/Cys-tRNA(Cys) deacylase